MIEKDAILSAKDFYKRPEGEPMIRSDCVLLREVVHAREVLAGASPDELMFSDNSWAAKEVLKSLRGGGLKARIYRENYPPEVCPIIPPHCWQESRQDYWTGEIMSDDDCDGYIGELPFLLLEEAAAWLEEEAVAWLETARQTKRTNHADESVRDRAFTEWVEARARIDKAPPTIKDCYAWGRDNFVEGVHTSRETIRSLRTKLPKKLRRPRRRPIKA